MRTWLAPLVLVLVLVESLAPQQRADLRVDGARGNFATRLTECRRALTLGEPTDAEDRAHRLLGCLRLSAFATSRELLAPRPAHDDLAAVCWAVVSHHWHLRATDDPIPVRRDLGFLRETLRDATVAPLTSDASFAEAALVVHAMFCLGDLSAVIDDDDDAASVTRRAVEHWLELERHAWQPGRGHFRVRPTGAQLALPEGPDATVLSPAAAGLLIATGDRLTRHLDTSLRLLLAGPRLDRRAAAWLLAGAAQSGDPEVVSAAWNRALESRADRGRMAGGDAGLELDAMLFAVTGSRVATGAGVDANCVRLRPWLPPGHDHLALVGLTARGRRFDLTMTARDGDPEADERDEATALGPRPGSRLRVGVQLEPAAGQAPCTFVIQGEGLQYVTPLGGGEQLWRSLPQRQR